MTNTLTLNPAVDKVLYLSALEKNVTSRIQMTTETIGGKGTHVSINLKLLGTNSNAFGVAYGATGKRIIDMLSQYGINVRFNYQCQGDSRTNYLLVENNGDCTVVAEKGVPISEQDLQILIQTMQDEIQTGDTLILSGDASNCTDSKVYNRILRALKNKKLKVFLDTSGEYLSSCINEGPFLIKPNLNELSDLCGKKLSLNDDEIIEAIFALDPYQIQIIAVSLGKYGSIIKMPDGIYKATPPKVNVYNTVGCGDCFLSGMIFGLNNQMDTIDTIKLATAISSATAESALSVGFDVTRAKELIPLVKVEKLRNFEHLVQSKPSTQGECI